MEKAITKWFQQIKDIMPKNTRVSVSLRRDGPNFFIVTFRTRFLQQNLVSKVTNRDVTTAINQAGFGLFRKVVQEKRKKTAERRQRFHFLDVA